MRYLQKCVKYLAILGVLLIILQVLLTSNYDLIRTVRNQTNTTALRIKSVLSGLDNEAFKTIGTKLPSKGVNDTTRVGHEGHNGFELAATAHNVCTSQHITSSGTMKTVHAIPKLRVLYCPMEKIGTTFWRRVFYMLVTKRSSKFKQPYDVPIFSALGQAKLFTQSITSSKSGNLLAKSSFSFLFVRNPYSRLLSAFIDKLVPPNPTFWKGFGVKAITQFRPKNAQSANAAVKGAGGHDVTFAEFVNFVVSSERSGRNIDAHIISINKGCKPCTNPYTYIGRMETFQDDAFFIMKKLQMNSTIQVMGETFSKLSTDDAITDSIRSPFSWKKDVIKYISWEKALQRIWLKLQMRGIIERKIRLNLTKEAVVKTNVNQFIEMARKAHRDSDPVELKKQKDDVKKEAFASVPLKDLKAFRETFQNDFALFGYDPSPSYMFDRGEEPQTPTYLFDYNHLN